MKKTIFLLAALLLLAGWTHGSPVLSPPITNAFTTLRTGGGGLAPGADLSTTGVRFLRGDAWSGYIWTTNLANCGPQAVTGCWYDFLSSGSLPSANFGLQPSTGISQKWQRPASNGILEVAGAPSDATVAYVNYGNRIYVSTNVDTVNPQNMTWTLASALASGYPTTANDDSNANPQRLGGRRMAVDPANPDHVIVGTYTIGIWETKNGRAAASATWTQISTSSIPIATTGYNIAFDPSSGTSVCGSAVCTNDIYIYTNGASPGLYVSVDAGVTYTQAAAGAPTSAQCLIVAPTGGVVWLVSASPGSNGEVWTYTGGLSGTWTRKLTAGWHWVAINPLNTLHVAVMNNSGSMTVSTDGGNTFGGTFAPNRQPGDSPWAAWSNQNFMTAGAINFDPLNNDLIIFAGGQAVWSTTFPSATNFSWTAIADGTQGGIAQFIEVPQANKPIFGYQDLGSFTYNTLNNVNPSTGFPAATAFSLQRMAGLSYPPNDAGFVAGKIETGNFGATVDLSGYSTDQFQGNYLPFNTWNATVAATNVSNNGSGAVRVTIPDTSGLTTWSAGAGSIVCSFTLKNTVANGISAGRCYAVNVISPTTFDLLGSAFVAGMATTGGSYQMWSPPTTELSNWSGTFNVIGTASSGGSIQVSYMFRNSNLLVANDLICFSGIQGTTEANGCWIAQSVTTTGASGSVVLGPTSTFTNAYTGGGAGARWGEPGGGIAAASRTNIAIAPANNGTPRCTTDGGLTWVNMTDPATLPPVQTTVTGGPYAAGTTVISVASVSGLSSGSVITITMDDGRLYTNTLASAPSGLNLTLNLPIPAGRSIANNAPLSIVSGWGFAAFNTFKQIAADQVQPNTFFAVNVFGGLYKWTNCGSPAGTLVQVNNLSPTNWAINGVNLKLKSVPGESGHLFFVAGPIGGETQNPGNNPNHPNNTSVWRTCNGDSNSAVVMQKVTGFFEPRNIGFGKTKPGSAGYPAIAVEGWYDPGNVQANAVYGIWTSTDDANHGNSGPSASCVGGNTWTNIGPWLEKHMSTTADLQGDPSIYGEWYVSTVRGAYYGMFN